MSLLVPDYMEEIPRSPVDGREMTYLFGEGSLEIGWPAVSEVEKKYPLEHFRLSLDLIPDSSTEETGN